MNINSSLQKTPVAVIGLSAIFADASDVEEFWTNIIQGKDSIKDVPPSRWRIEDYYDPDVNAPDKTYCKRGGFMPEIDFNPLEFGLPPNILEVTDVSQLLALVAARDALEDAGYGKKSAKFTKELKEKTGVLLGVGGGQKLITPLNARLQYPVWKKALLASGIKEEDVPPIIEKIKKAYVGWNENSFPGFLGNVISGRITNRFDLGGINSVVDAACAASLSAIKMALSELVEGRCDMMLTGGVDTDNSPFMYMSFSKTPAFSKSGQISPFSAKADGMLIGEGVGMMVLKRLADAERDGDQIYALIKGVGTSSDGRFKSVYAPRPSGQALAMSRAYEEAGYKAASVGLIEAHGTGTEAGDPTEFTSMQMVFGKDNPRKQHIALGSVKSQIGHTKAAAGAAGMVKAVLALHHKVLPPTINVEQPNPKFDIPNSPFYLNTEARPWIKNGSPRRASVSAFGFGGINVHIALEEYAKTQATNYRLHEPYKIILLQAENPRELLNICQANLSKLQSAEADDFFDHLAKKSKEEKLLPAYARLGFVARHAEDCLTYLQIAVKKLDANSSSWTHPQGVYYRSAGVDALENKVVALFSGQGAQYTGMGKELVSAFPEVRSAFEQMDSLFDRAGAPPLSKTVFPIPVFNDADKVIQQKKLRQTQYAQPAIGSLSMGMYKIMREAGLKPGFTAGHSFGELTALWAAGLYDDEVYWALTKARGDAMSIQSNGSDAGAMLAVNASVERLKPAIAPLRGVTVANINSANQVILGGNTLVMQKTAQQLKEQGFLVTPLPVSAAFHTDLVRHAQEPFARFLEQQTFNRPQIPVYSNSTAQAYPSDPRQIKTILKEHILKPVLFKEQIENIYQAGGRIFIEFGPKGILTNLVKDILKGKDFHAIATNPNPKNDSDRQFRQAVVQLKVLGLELSNIDTYKRDKTIGPGKAKLNVKLSGNNYVSASTQKAYQDVLNDGFKVSGSEPRIVEKTVEVEKIVEVPVEKVVEIEKIVEVPVEKIVEIEKVIEVPVEKIIPVFNNREKMDNKETAELLKSALEHFKTQQVKSLEIFERFLNQQHQQSQQLIELLTKQLGTAVATQATVTPTSKPLEKTEDLTSAVSETILQTNGAYSNGSRASEKIEAKEVTPPPVAVAKAPVAPQTIAPSSGVDTKKMEGMLMTVVSEKTGYPAEMLELNMDMEADLGIDSIKRVEIFGALTSQYPEMAGLDLQELAELRTLGEIVTYVSDKQGGESTVAPAKTEPTQTLGASPENTASAPSSDLDDQKMAEILLGVVSEKTGYPAEMLELNMDMEADLGIDSIKRVEIFGALTNQYPEMAGLDLQELGELRTLQEIVGYIGRTEKKKTS